MADRHQSRVTDWVGRLRQMRTAGGRVGWEGFPPVPALTARFVILMGVDIAVALIAYRLSYVVRSLSTFGIFRTAMAPTAFSDAPHAWLLIAAFQVLAVWLIGGYRPGVRLASRPFLIRLVIAGVAEAMLLMPAYNRLLGPTALPSVFPIYALLNPVCFILGRVGYATVRTLRQGGMTLLEQLPHALPRYLPRRLIRRPSRRGREDQVNYLEQLTRLLDDLELAQRNRESLNAKATDAPSELVERLTAEYENRAAQLRLQLSVALGGLRRQGRQAVRRTGELRDEITRVQAQAPELQLRHEIGELDAEVYQQREDERLAAIEACQKELDEQQALLDGIQQALRRTWTIAPELRPPARKPGPPEGGWYEEAERPEAEWYEEAEPPTSRLYEVPRPAPREVAPPQHPPARPPDYAVGEEAVPPEGGWYEEPVSPLPGLGEGPGVRAAPPLPISPAPLPPGTPAPLLDWIEGADERQSLVDRVIQYFIHNPGAIFIIGFQVLLINCAFLLIAKQEQAAENLANIAYLLLVVGVGINLVQMIRERPEGEEREEKREAAWRRTIRRRWSRVRERLPRWRGRPGRRAPQPEGARLMAGSPWLRLARTVLIVAGVSLGLVLVGMAIWPGRTPPESSTGFMESSGNEGQPIAFSTQTTPSPQLIQPSVQPTPFRPTATATRQPSPTPTATRRPEPCPEPAEGLVEGATPTPSHMPTATESPTPLHTPTATQRPEQSPEPSPKAVEGATPVPPPASPTPAEILRPAPSLLSPDPGATLAGPVTLLWFWPLTLAEDELFEVRAWKAGQAVQAIERTQSNYVIWEPPATGTYNWQVAVVRLEGDTTTELGLPSPIRQFVWVGR